MWLIHKGKRDTIVNLEAWDEIHVQQCSIVFIRNEQLRIMEYNTEEEARQAFGYLMEALKRGDRLTNI